MTPFEVAAAAVVVIGILGVGWVLWPIAREAAAPAAPPEPPADQRPDWQGRLHALVEGARSAHDDGAPWVDRLPMIPEGPRRIPGDLTPWEVLPALVESDRVTLIPIASALVRAPFAEGPVLRGRRQGRAFHAVRLKDDVFLDLVELARVLPVIGVELVARGIEGREVRFFEDLDRLTAETGLSGEAVDVAAAWMMGGDGARVLPESEGAAVFALRIEGGELEVRAWMPAVAAGIARDRLEWAGVATWRRGGEAVVEPGATSADVLGELGVDPAVRAASLETWRWSRDELVEVAGFGYHLESLGMDPAALLDDAFADRCVPVPPTPDDALIAAAILNWRGVVARRAGRTAQAIATFDAAQSILAPDDDDTRADLHYNRGYARLQARMAGPPIDGEGELKTAVFAEIPPREDLLPALEDFRIAARYHPNDPHAWSQQAMVHQLLGDRAAAEECWLQAATRTKDPEAHTRLLANARAMREPPPEARG